MDIYKISLAVGLGENRFRMKRGSFKYKRKTYYRSETVLIEKENTEDGTRLTFLEKKKNRKHVLFIKDSSSDQHKSGVCELIYESIPYEDVNRYYISFDTEKDEKIFGCGETYSHFDLRGSLVRIWVAEHQNARRIATKLIKQKLLGKRYDSRLKFEAYESYYAQPSFTTSGKTFVHVDTDGYCEFDFRKDDKITLDIETPPHIFFLRDTKYRGLFGKVSDLLGHRRALPEWIYDGIILASQDWKKDEEGHAIPVGDGIGNVERKLETCRKAGIPVTGVWCQDWCGCRCTKFGYQVMWNWKYDPEKYPDLPASIRRWKQEGVSFLGYINPFLALEGDLYAEAAEKGYCVKDKDGRDYLVTITTFPAAMVDFTNPDAYEWYKDIIKRNLIGIGMGGWMADFGEYLPTDSVLFSGEDPERVHNIWPALWAEMNRKAIEETGSEGEVFFFTRAGHTGTIRHSDMMWTGDQHVDWSIDDGLPSVITAIFSLAMSGFGFTHSDVGGYTTIMHMTRSRELLMRWEEMNAFSPLFRVHEGNQPGRNVQVLDDDELLGHLAVCAAWHSLLKDYLRELEDEAEKSGTPFIKPLFFNYDDPEIREEYTEYLLGDDLLIAPVIKEGCTVKTVSFPFSEGEAWKNIFSGEVYSGGICEVDSGLGKPPVFVRVKDGMIKETLKPLMNYTMHDDPYDGNER